MSMHHRIVVIGGGNAGLSVAARLRNAGQDDVAVIEPSTEHYYQPLWTLVGGGAAPRRESVRPEAQVMPQGVAWIKDSASAIEPDDHTVRLASGGEVGYDYLVVSPGLQLDWNRVPGMEEAIAGPQASSNYDYELAPKTWKLIKGMKRGTAVFTMPSGPIKCAGAPQKIAYLAADYWRQQGVLDEIRVVLVLPTPGMFGVEVFAKELDKVVERYGIEVRFNSEVTDIDPAAQAVTITDNSAHSSEQLDYTMLHVVPPQSAPDWIKHSPVAKPGDPNGYVDIDPNTLQHVRWPEIFALGDAGSSPNSKTGAAIRKQAPVVVENLLATMEHRPVNGRYEGYASCPLTTSRNTMLLAEFDYSMQPAPSIPVIDTTHERRDMWYLKRYGLPAMYWNLILKGRA
ncbi:FAD/NAD(P)-binding oxidoreductase [Brevibacterium picturae]|uniref:FAD/NAD(P)-binding oxidoreductase n=1 Tax=Brevibacterium picturae TaxID=260553 RepID=A0ABN2CJ78_9MICO